MSNAIEETLKALTDFESALDKAKSDAAEAKRVMIKSAGDWADEAKSNALAGARDVASQAASKAKEEAEAEAAEIRAKGKKDLKGFEDSLSRHRAEAAELVTKMLLGESA